MRIKSESEILDAAKRKAIIQEIEGYENRARKDEAWRRYQAYKDSVAEQVIRVLLQQFDATTVDEMRYSIANLSIVRKVIDKLARVYSYGADRSIEGSENDTKKLQDLAKKLDLQTAMKKTNRFLKLQKNLALFVKPVPTFNKDGAVEKWGIKLEPLNPYLYDVIEDYYDRTKPMIFILSDYTPTSIAPASFANVTSSAMSHANSASPVPAGDGRDQKIADTPTDANAGSAKTYVFWSRHYHFTCDANGEIIDTPEKKDTDNPFGVCTLVNYAIDQDGSFWAQGGGDLVDGAVLVNAMISHTNHVGVVQGYGQFYATGENLPRQIKLGPTKAIVAEYKEGEQAEPKFGFLNANPQLDSLRGLIEMYIALLLTTNNLSTSGVSTQLAGGQSLASGIALIIDKAESLEDVQDQRQVFIDKEPEVFEAINAVIKTYGAEMDEDIRGLQLTEGFESKFSIKFHDAPTIMSEKEKLENMEARKSLGLDSELSLLMKDDPSLTEEQAEKKLARILEDKIKAKMLEIEVAKKLAPEYNVDDGASPDPKMSKDGEIPPKDQGGSKGPGLAPVPNPNDKLPNAGENAPADDVQKLALNGAQVTAMVDMVKAVAAGEIPRLSAVAIIETSFNVDTVTAEKILADAGAGFKPEKKEPVNTPPAPPKGGAPDEGDKGNDDEDGNVGKP